MVVGVSICTWLKKKKSAKKMKATPKQKQGNCECICFRLCAGWFVHKCIFMSQDQSVANLTTLHSRIMESRHYGGIFLMLTRCRTISFWWWLHGAELSQTEVFGTGKEGRGEGWRGVWMCRCVCEFMMPVLYIHLASLPHHLCCLKNEYISTLTWYELIYC